jgi:hypothetical protein
MRYGRPPAQGWRRMASGARVQTRDQSAMRAAIRVVWVAAYGGSPYSVALDGILGFSSGAEKNVVRDLIAFSNSTGLSSFT